MTAKKTVKKTVKLKITGTTKLTDLKAQKLSLEIAKLEQELWRATKENELVKTRPEARGNFTFVGSVEERGVHNLIDHLDIWSENHPGEDITLTINSPGGVVIDGFALYDYLQDMKRRGHKITTRGLGMQASMGGILLQAGSHRVMSTRSWLLIHEVQGLALGSFSAMEDDMTFNKRLQEQALDILADRSTLTRPAIKKKWKYKDWWLSAEDALRDGFIDAIED